MSYLNSDNALALARLFEEIPNVKQVRFNYVLRDDLKEQLGENSINYCCLIESLDQSNVSQIGSTAYERMMVVIPERIYEDVENHGQIQSVMNERIGQYYRTGVISDTAGHYAYPYSVDADGNQIPYSLNASNPNWQKPIKA